MAVITSRHRVLLYVRSDDPLYYIGAADLRATERIDRTEGISWFVFQYM